MQHLNESQKELWQNIQSFIIGNPRATFGFTQRLARENAWSYEFALRVEQEYKKFMFMICIAEHPLTPSDQVDQAWHLHLLYTKSYWEDFCEQVLQRAIHHQPTEGGEKEKGKFDDWYSKTKEFYVKIFEKEPPVDIWPSAEIRFGEIRFERVNLHRYWVTKKPKIFL